MPVLTRRGGWATLLALVALLYACDRPSREYRQISKLPYARWDGYASTLPLERRLDLHKEILSRSGSNPPMTVAFSFGRDPAASYRAIVHRLDSGDSDRAYLGLLFAIEGAKGFSICAQPDRRKIQAYVQAVTRGYSLSRDPAKFYFC